ERLGAVFVEDESEVPEGEVCVLSAHGVAPSVKANAEARGLKVVDATCPLVNKVHAEARTYADSGHLVALVGHANHVEVIGTLGATRIFVIGSENSSNAQRLVEVAHSAGAEATLVDGESPLDADLLDGHETVGLTAGASTPEELVRATADRLAACGYDTLEEITVAREDVHFRLPREVASA